MIRFSKKLLLILLFTTHRLVMKLLKKDWKITLQKISKSKLTRKRKYNKANKGLVELIRIEDFKMITILDTNSIQKDPTQEVIIPENVVEITKEEEEVKVNQIISMEDKVGKTQPNLIKNKVE